MAPSPLKSPPLKSGGVFMNLEGNVASPDQWSVTSMSVPCASCLVWNMEAPVRPAVLRWLVKRPHAYSEPSFPEWNSRHSHREHGACSEMRREASAPTLWHSVRWAVHTESWEEGFAREGGSSWGFPAGSLPGLYTGVKVIKT